MPLLTDTHFKGVGLNWFSKETSTMGVFRTGHGVLHQTSHVSPRSSYFALSSPNFDAVNVNVPSCECECDYFIVFCLKKNIGKTF